jgi:hypothetical protein
MALDSTVLSRGRCDPDEAFLPALVCDFLVVK